MIEIIKWLLASIIIILLGYCIVRVLSKGVFKSFFEARSEFHNKIKEEKVKWLDTIERK